MKALFCLLSLLSACAVYHVGGDDNFESEPPQEKTPEVVITPQPAQPTQTTQSGLPSCQAAPEAPLTEAQRESARALFEEGERLYKTGDFERAAQKFLEAYQFVLMPEMILNVAQSYRRAGRKQEAYNAFLLYLCLDPSSFQRKEVEKTLQELAPTP